MRPNAFVQVGATRDGLDPYLDCANRRGLRTVLVETPAYLRRRQAMARRPFDVELGLDRPHDPAEVAAALRADGIRPVLLLTGFERYVASGFAVAERLRVPPWPAMGRSFVPVDKWGQRNALALSAPDVRQPRYASFPAGTEVTARAVTPLGFPVVVKPTDGGGGLGVFLVETPEEVPAAVARLRVLRNYGDGEFAGLLIEEFLPGKEFSLQGVVFDGDVVLLSVCEKVVTREPDTDGLMGFREVGHILQPGRAAPPEFTHVARAAVAVTGYREGPFHVDIISGEGGPAFVEMGFRLSGGAVVSLMKRATSVDWAESVFRAHLGEEKPPHAPAAGVVGQVAVVAEHELAAAEELRARGARVEVLRFAPPLPGGGTARDPQLASDLLRHAGAIGRVVITGDDVATVREQLEGCVAARLRR